MSSCTPRRSIRNRIFAALLPLAYFVFRLQDVVYRLIGKTDWGVPDQPPAVPMATAAPYAPEYGYVRDRWGHRLFYRAWPPCQGEARAALVAIDGMGSDAKQFHPIGTALAPRGIVFYALDTPGQGLSDGPRSDWTLLPRIVDGVSDFLCYLAGVWPGRPVYLLGESIGGPLAMQLADRSSRPANLAGLVLSSTELDPTRLTARGRWAAVWTILKQVPYFFFASPAPSVDIAGCQKLVARGAEIEILSRPDPLRNDHVSVRTMVAVFALINRAFDLATRLTLPTLVLQGSGDQVNDPESSIELMRCLATPDKQLVFFPGAAHGLFYDPDTPRVLEVIADWLERHLMAQPALAQVTTRIGPREK